MELDVDSSSGDVIITLKSISTLSRKDRSWSIRKISDDANRVLISLQTASDSLYGSDFHSMKLSKLGQGICIGVTRDDKYFFYEVTGTSDLKADPAVSTQQPDLSGTTLNMYGSLDDLDIKIIELYALDLYKI